MITYGHEAFIADAIKGVLMQIVDFNVELIIADDASPDNTKEIVNGFQNHKNFNWIKYTQHSKNSGMMSNFVWALEQVRGKYIALCEGDDFWTDPFKLRKQVDFLEANEDFGLVFTDCDILKQVTGEINKEIFKNKIYDFKIDFISHLINAYFFAPCTWLVRTNQIKNKENYLELTDVTFLIMLEILFNSKVKMLSESTAVYRVLEESASHSKDLSKEYLWWQGVNSIKLSIAKNYDVDENILELLKIHMYSLTLRKYAFSLDDKLYIEEAKNFFETINAQHIFSALKSEYFKEKEANRKSYKIYKKIQYFIEKTMTSLQKTK